MLAWIGSLQPLLLGAVLLWSARAKLLSRYATAHARRTALSPLLGEERAVLAYRLLGGVEAALGATLLIPGLVRVEAVAATALSAGFLAYLSYAKIAAPDSSCGCLSSQPIPVNGRSFGRAGLMLAGSLLAVVSGAGWVSGLADRPVLGVALLLAEGAAIVATSTTAGCCRCAGCTRDSPTRSPRPVRSTSRWSPVWTSCTRAARGVSWPAV